MPIAHRHVRTSDGLALDRQGLQLSSSKQLTTRPSELYARYSRLTSWPES